MPLRSLRHLATITLVSLAGMPPVHAAEPQWLVDARAREGAALPPAVLKSEDGGFTATLPAKLIGRIDAADGNYTLALEVGSAAQVNCEVIRGGFDTASLLRKTAALTFDEIAKVQGQVEMRSVERSDAGAYAGSPYLALDWVYLVKQDGKPMLGMLKQTAVMKDGHGLYCSHVDIGYARTFEGVVKALTETLVVKEPAPAPYYREISALTLDGRKVGVATTSLTRDADGDSKIEVVTAMLLPVGGAELRAHDTFDVQWTRPDGTLLNATQTSAENGELRLNLKLLPTDDGWIVAGEMQGKKLEQKLAAEPAPASYLAEALARRALLAQERPGGSRRSQWQWMSADPLKLTETHLEVLAATEGGYAAREKAGPLTMESILDPATGMPSRASLPLGRATLMIERVHVQGRF